MPNHVRGVIVTKGHTRRGAVTAPTHQAVAPAHEGGETPALLVYELYGLTEEEIAIVEEASG